MTSEKEVPGSIWSFFARGGDVPKPALEVETFKNILTDRVIRAISVEATTK